MKTIIMSILLIVSLKAYAPKFHNAILIKDESIELLSSLYQVDYLVMKSSLTAMQIKASWLLNVIYIESRFNRNATNSTGTIGYIQFTPSTLKGMGLNRANFSIDIEFKATVKHISFYKNRIKSYEDLYLAIFFPKALTKPDSYILATDRFSAYTIAKSNPILNLNKDSILTKAEVKRAAFELLPDTLRNKLN
jgi:hypothetical protein